MPALARDRGSSRHPGRRGLAASGSASASQATAGLAARSAASGPGYQATIVRTAYGIPHITARNFGPLGYGFALLFSHRRW